MNHIKDLTGKRFGRLVVQGIERRDTSPCGQKKIMWSCLCDCGNTTVVSGGNLKTVRSCRCIAREGVTKRNFKHGRKYTPEYRSYTSARKRCTNPKYEGWERYGGRGIQFHFASFEEFFAELGPRPKGTTVDRINNDGHYQPGNVRWATALEQRHNRSADGKEKTRIRSSAQQSSHQ